MRARREQEGIPIHPAVFTLKLHHACFFFAGLTLKAPAEKIALAINQCLINTHANNGWMIFIAK